MNAARSEAERAQYVLARCRKNHKRRGSRNHDQQRNKLIHDLPMALQRLEHPLCDPARRVPRASLEICEVPKSEGVVVATRSVAVLGELSRIDRHLLDDVALLDHVCDLFVGEVEPFIIGVGEVRVIRDEPFKLLIVGGRGYRRFEQVHGANPSVAVQLSPDKPTSKIAVPKMSPLC